MRDKTPSQELCTDHSPETQTKEAEGCMCMRGWLQRARDKAERTHRFGSFGTVASASWASLRC